MLNNTMITEKMPYKIQDFYRFLEEIGFIRVNNNYKKTYARSNVSLRIDEYNDIAYIAIRDKKGWRMLNDFYLELPGNDEGKVSILIGCLIINNILDLNDLEIFMTKYI